MSNDDISTPPEETPTVEEPVEVDKSVTLSEYVSDFNYQLRYTVDTDPINRGVSNEEFISCAKTLLISEMTLSAFSISFFNSEKSFATA
mgnify:CR=1 FL=1